MHKRHYEHSGFTIVELLVVIVVIGILAAITIASFSGISQRAVVASLQADLSTAARQLKAFSVENGAYPVTISTDCSASPDTLTNKCLKASPGNSYTIYPYSSTPSTFVLTEVNGSLVYRVTENSAPGQVTPLTGIGAITGTAQVDLQLSVGALTPPGATATYQWQRCFVGGTSCTEISGATGNTYTVVSADLNFYINVVATGISPYFSSVTSATTSKVNPNPWIAGLASTTLAGKYVYYMDASGGSKKWKTDQSSCLSPQCSTTVYPAPDPSFPTSNVLADPIVNSGTDFSAYPAQAACRALGGRLPTVPELQAIKAATASYGNNFQPSYWSATDYSSTNAYYVYGTGTVNNWAKDTAFAVRCVRG